MRIGIDATPILGDRGGVGWHTYHLLKALLDLKDNDGRVEFVAYVRPGALNTYAADLEPFKAAEAAGRLRWVEAGKFGMRWRGRMDGLDLYHGTNFKMRTSGRFGGVVTVHDLWLDRYPQYSTKLLGQRASFYRTKRTAWRARRVITVSEASARDIESLYGLPRNRIAVIPNAVSDDFCPLQDPDGPAQVRRRFGLPTDRFILFVGGADPRKNHRALLRACAQRADRLSDYCLVLVGDVQHRFGDMMETARGLGLESHVVCPGRLSLADLRLLYSQATVFVFPSIYEGFGMPVLEAMACGAPVITSNSTSLPEVAGDAALLVDPENVEALGDALQRMVEDAALQATLRAKGFERVKGFTWDRSARLTMNLYRELCAVV
ncbi:MAG: glycosyltransferase family 1 protein [Nitrospirae bacterium]|nr:MAG: glycosyltransferase family 1 protein [Nitrospirota bacterium]